MCMSSGMQAKPWERMVKSPAVCFCAARRTMAKRSAQSAPSHPRDSASAVAARCRRCVDHDGNRVYALFRSAFDNGMSRHIVSLVSHDGGKTFATCHRGQVVHRRMSDEQHVPGGGPSRRDRRVGATGTGVSRPVREGAASPTHVIAPEGKAGARKHPVLAVDANGQTLLAWTEGTGWQKGGSLAWQLFDRNFSR